MIVSKQKLLLDRLKEDGIVGAIMYFFTKEDTKAKAKTEPVEVIENNEEPKTLSPFKQNSKSDSDDEPRESELSTFVEQRKK